MAEPGRKNGASPGPEAKSGEAGAEEILEQVESGPRSPDLPVARIAILLLCIAWSGYQLYIAYQPVNATIARAWHLAFAILLVYLVYPAYNEARPPFQPLTPHGTRRLDEGAQEQQDQPDPK